MKLSRTEGLATETNPISSRQHSDSRPPKHCLRAPSHYARCCPRLGTPLITARCEISCGEFENMGDTNGRPLSTQSGMPWVNPSHQSLFRRLRNELFTMEEF
ncbi:MAG: hypothetical protein KatS3mg111_2704 [Pirellulaceae bacterium]|nr:MAG: hypothetical protein KatS3mg111_2704 [Pirellulaceae bacterium]